MSSLDLNNVNVPTTTTVRSEGLVEAEEPEPDPLAEIGAWATADPKRRVAILGKTDTQIRHWAREHELPGSQVFILTGDSLQVLFGMSGDQNAIVLLPGHSRSKKVQTRISVCQADDVRILRESAPVEPPPALLGGVSVGWSAPGKNGITAKPHHDDQGDNFIVSGQGAELSIHRNQMPAVIELMRVWLESQPWKDPSAVRAEQIRAAVAATNDPFADPEDL